MRDVQVTLGSEVAVGIVIEDGNAIFDVIINGVNLTAFRVDLDAGNETNFGLWADDLPHGRGDAG